MAQQRFNSPIEQAQDLVYKKPTLDDGFYLQSFKDGYKVNNGEARLGKGRLDYLISEYGVWDDDSDYSQAYLGFIDPQQFLNGTLTNQDSYTKKEIDAIKDFDLDRINRERQTPFLDVDFDTNSIIGHEGRHRMKSLINGGVKKIPVVFRDRSKSFQKYKSQPRNFKGQLNGQDYGELIGKSNPALLDTELIPLNYKNAAKLWEKFGNGNHE